MHRYVRSTIAGAGFGACLALGYDQYGPQLYDNLSDTVRIAEAAGFVAVGALVAVGNDFATHRFAGKIHMAERFVGPLVEPPIFPYN